MTSSSTSAAAGKNAKSIDDLTVNMRSGSSAGENSASSKKTLDLEPNPFEQSFAQNKDKEDGHTRGQSSKQTTSSSFLQNRTTRAAQHGNSTSITQPTFPQSMSPPILTPGGTRRLPPTSVLPPLVGMLTPGGGSLPGTPGIWSALLGAGATPGSATSPYFNIPALTDQGQQGIRSQAPQLLPNTTSRQSQTVQSQRQKQPQQHHQRQTVQVGQSYNYVKKETNDADDPSSLRNGSVTNPGFVPQLSARLPSVGGLNGLMGSISGFATTPGGSLTSLSLQTNTDGSATDAAGDRAAQTIMSLKMSEGASSSTVSRSDRKTDKPIKEPAKKRRKMEGKMLKSVPNISRTKRGKAGRKRKSRNDMSEEEKRNNFLERNRLAASKCRQRKKKMVEKMKEDLQFYTSQYSTLTSHISILREHVLTLRTILYAHKGCQKLIEQVGGVETLNALLNGTNYVSQLPQAHRVPTPSHSSLEGMASPMRLDSTQLDSSHMATQNLIGNSDQSQLKTSARGSTANNSVLNNSLTNAPASNSNSSATSNMSGPNLQGSSPPQVAVAAAVALSANSLINRHQNAKIHN